MQVMRKLISILLLATTLFANVAWAVNAHVEFLDINSKSSEVHSHDTDTGDHDSDSEGFDDHCCHGFAHLAGLSLQNSIIFGWEAEGHLVASLQHYTTRYKSPPTPPPNI